MRINELSKLAGVTNTTIRFYEKSGVLPKAARNKNGYRHYPEERIVQLQMIVKAKDLGFTLKEVKELSAMLFSKKLNHREMAKRLEKKNAEIDQRIESLHQMKQEINHVLKGLCEFRQHLEKS